MKKTTFAAAVLAFSLMEAPALEIVKDGKPQAEIVLLQTANPSQKAAAADLHKYIREISGAELPIVHEPTRSCKNQIYIIAGNNR